MEAAQTHGYNTPKGMELAALRTRRAKEDQTLDRLFDRWREEAKALGFPLEQDPQARRAREVERLTQREQSANQQQQAKPAVRQPQREARAGDRTKAGPPEAGRSRDRATIAAPPPAQQSRQTASAVKSPPASSQQLATAERSPAEIRLPSCAWTVCAPPGNPIALRASVDRPRGNPPPLDRTVSICPIHRGPGLWRQDFVSLSFYFPVDDSGFHSALKPAVFRPT